MKHIWKTVTAALTAAVLCIMPTVVRAAEAEDVSSASVSGQEKQTERADGLNPESIVLTVGEDEVPLKKAYFLVKFQQAIVQDMQKSIYGSQWYNLPIYEGDRSFQDNMKDSIMNLLVRMSLARQNQEALGIRLSEEEQKHIKEAVDNFMASNSEEARKAMMADEEVVTEILEDYTILSKAITAVTQDVEAEYTTARTYSYVYASFGEDAGTEDLNDVSEETETMLEAFHNIRKAVAGGTDFDTAAAEQGYPTAIHTYFEGDTRDALAEFNEAMDGKGSGEVSDIVYVGENAGAFIGCMQELDEDSLADAKSSFLLSEQLKELKRVVRQWLEKAPAKTDANIWNRVTMEKSISAYRTDTTTQ